MPSAFLARLREQFPEADRLAFERLLAGRTIFFNKAHRQLFSENLIFAALFIANASARKAGASLKLTDREKRIWNRHFETPKKCQ